jgi:hypothetical protein
MPSTTTLKQYLSFDLVSTHFNFHWTIPLKLVPIGFWKNKPTRGRGIMYKVQINVKAATSDPGKTQPPHTEKN